MAHLQQPNPVKASEERGKSRPGKNSGRNSSVNTLLLPSTRSAGPKIGCPTSTEARKKKRMAEDRKLQEAGAKLCYLHDSARAGWPLLPPPCHQLPLLLRDHDSLAREAGV